MQISYILNCICTCTFTVLALHLSFFVVLGGEQLYLSLFAVPIGEQLYLSCTANGNPSPLFQWLQRIDDQVYGYKTLFKGIVSQDFRGLQIISIYVLYRILITLS